MEAAAGAADLLASAGVGPRADEHAWIEGGQEKGLLRPQSEQSQVQERRARIASLLLCQRGAESKMATSRLRAFRWASLTACRALLVL